MGRIQSYVHDSESCFWVLVSSSRRLFALAGNVSAAEDTLHHIFPAIDVSHEEWVGMVSSRFDWLTGSESAIQFECGPLSWLVEKLRVMFGDWYRGRFEHKERPDILPFEGDQMVQNFIDLCEEALAMDGWPAGDAQHHRWDSETTIPGTPAMDSIFGDTSWLDDREDGKMVYFEVKPRYDEQEKKDDYVPLFFLPRHLKRLALENTKKTEELSPKQSEEHSHGPQVDTPLGNTGSDVMLSGASRPMKGLPRRRHRMRNVGAPN